MPDILKTLAINVNPRIRIANIQTFHIISFRTVQRSDSNNFGNIPGKKSVFRKKLAALIKPMIRTKYPSFGDARKFIPKG